MTKEIKLTKDKVAIVDDGDFEYLSQWKWYEQRGYARRNCYKGGRKNPKPIFMHRIIMDCPDNLFIDHSNQNKLDNRKENLRICTSAENRRNSKAASTNTSGFKGVSAKGSRWQVSITVNKKQIHIGYFGSKSSAAQAYDEAAIKFYGRFARTNKMMGLL